MRIADLLGCLELSHVASIIDHTLDVLVVTYCVSDSQHITASLVCPNVHGPCLDF